MGRTKFQIVLHNGSHMITESSEIKVKELLCSLEHLCVFAPPRAQILKRSLLCTAPRMEQKYINAMVYPPTSLRSSWNSWSRPNLLRGNETEPFPLPWYLPPPQYL